jgi:pimeloyl-ACP methyl ester carboxylesterase
LRTEALVTIAAPSRVLSVLRRFAAFMGLPREARYRFIRQVERLAGMPVKQLDVSRYSLDMPGLVVHAEDDPQVPVDEAQAIHAAWPGSRLLRLQAGGHQRVLADPALSDAVLALLEGQEVSRARRLALAS